MPFGVKMGIKGTTGYLGRKTKTKRAVARAAQRRRVLPGFPVERPFASIEEVRERLRRLMGDIEHHLQRLSDLAWDDVQMELGGSE